MLFCRKKAGLCEENMLTASEIGVEFEPVSGEWIGLKDLGDLSQGCRRLLSGTWFRGVSRGSQE